MLLEGPCPDFAYVTVLRDPVARLQSQLERMSDRPNHRLHELLSRPHVYNHSETSSLMGTAALDNYLIRMLLGPSVFFLPLRAINASHLKAATAVLSRFAAAVPLDALDGDGAALLRTVLHWRGTPHRANGHRAAWSAAAAAAAAAAGCGGPTPRTLVHARQHRRRGARSRPGARRATTDAETTDSETASAGRTQPSLAARAQPVLQP